ncbi:MAG: archease, partial [Acidimicrobiia bacterium]|nr:archease [Acidimicrobiia bacterium]
MPRTVLSHTADTGIDATAPTLGELIEELATGMFELVAGPAETEPSRAVEATVEGGEPADLVVDALSELLYLSEVEDVVFGVVDVVETNDGVGITAGGMPSG